jgi:hypothetical protein
MTIIAVGTPTFSPAVDSITPTLYAEVTFTNDEGREMPLFVEGELRTNGKLIARMRESLCAGGRQAMRALATYVKGDKVEFTRALVAELSPVAIAHIEESRASNPKGDVSLQLIVLVRDLASNVAMTFLEPGMRVPDRARDTVAIMRADNRPAGTRVVLTDDGDGFLSVGTAKWPLLGFIPSSEWVHTFAPAFGLGSFLVFEVPHLEPSAAPAGVSATFVQEFEAAVEAATNAQSSLARGEWSDVAEGLRPVVELLRNQRAAVEALLTRDGYHADACSEYSEMISHQFGLLSKFLHRLDKGKRLQPQVDAKKEDAYYLLATTAGVLNLIARKLQRYG